MLALFAMEVVRCCPFIATDHQGTKQSKSRETQKGYRGMRFWGRVAVDLGYQSSVTPYLQILVKLELQKKTQVHGALGSGPWRSISKLVLPLFSHVIPLRLAFWKLHSSGYTQNTLWNSRSLSLFPSKSMNFSLHSLNPFGHILISIVIVGMCYLSSSLHFPCLSKPSSSTVIV